MSEECDRLTERLAKLEVLVEEGFKSRDNALVLQGNADRIHFESLNNEADRISKAAALSVSREVYEADKKATFYLIFGLAGFISTMLGIIVLLR